MTLRSSGTAKVMVVGFPSEAMRGLTHELRAVGHHVLGAVGKQGAWTFLRAAPWDVVLVPRGPDGERARSWVEELGLDLPIVAVPEGPLALEWLARFLSGEEPEPPPPEAEPELEPGFVTDSDDASSAAVEPAPSASDRLETDLRTGDVGEASTSASIEVETFEPPPLPPLEASPVSPNTRRRRRPDARPDGEAEGREPHPDLASKLAVVRFGDYHSILEVEPHASPYAVREQRERLAHRFSPRGWPGRLMPEELDMLDEIARGIADAFLILGTPELAARYERALAQSPSRGFGWDEDPPR